VLGKGRATVRVKVRFRVNLLRFVLYHAYCTLSCVAVKSQEVYE